MTGYRAEQLEELAKGWTIEKITGKEYDTYNYTGH